MESANTHYVKRCRFFVYSDFHWKLNRKSWFGVIIPCSNISLNPSPNPNPNPNQRFICHVLTLMDWRSISRTENTELLPDLDKLQIRVKYTALLSRVFFDHPRTLLLSHLIWGCLIFHSYLSFKPFVTMASIKCPHYWFIFSLCSYVNLWIYIGYLAFWTWLN